jgi:hypothetical protein
MEITTFEKAESNFTTELLNTFADIQQSRTNFQIDNFVIRQHETPEMQFKQVCIELQEMYYTIRRVGLNIKKTEIEIKELRATGKESDELEAQIKELGLEQTRIIAHGTFRELERLLQIYNSFEHKFTRQEIEAGQENYWNRRLHRQATLEAIGGSQAQAAHLDALRQIGAIEVTKEGINTVNISESQKEIE